jgi:hypothetical protein
VEIDELNVSSLVLDPAKDKSPLIVTEPYSLLGRIDCESEPPNLATEIEATDRSICAANPPSPVRMCETRIVKTPWNRVIFSG